MFPNHFNTPYQQQYSQQPLVQQAYPQQVALQQPQIVGAAHASQQAQSNSTTTTTTTSAHHSSANPYGSQPLQPQFNHTQQQQLLAPTPQPQPQINYMQLQRLPAPTPQPAIDYMQLQNSQALSTLQQQQQAQQTMNTTTTKTHVTTSTSSKAGGSARQAAAAKGQSELRRFDQRVQEMLVRASGQACPENYKYYKGNDGYLCGGGHHFVTDESVDAMMNDGRPPFIMSVNPRLLFPGAVVVAPPPEAWHEAMHRTPVARHCANGGWVPGYKGGTVRYGPEYFPMALQALNPMVSAQNIIARLQGRPPPPMF